MKKVFLSGISIFCAIIFSMAIIENAQAQLTVVQGAGLSLTPTQFVQQVMVGGGVSVSNATFNGSAANITSNMIGKFQTAGVATTQLGFTGGAIICSGNATGAIGPNSSGSNGTAMGTGSDPDLQLLIPSHTVYDKAVLEFDFVPIADTIRFRYVFGSEEFDEFCNTSFNDVFGFFISGPGISGPFSGGAINIAIMPGTTSNYVTIDNVCSTGSLYSWLNTSGVYYQYDRLTNVFTAMCVVQPCQQYHIKLAVGDAGDQNYDSGVFLEANSFSTSGISFSTHYTSNIDTVAVEGCNNAIINFILNQPATDSIIIHYNLSGTATEGVDYPAVPDSLIIAPGQDSVHFTIIPISDSIPEPTETVYIAYQNTVCGTYDTIVILIKDYTPIVASVTPNVYTCNGQPATIGVAASDGYPPLTYSWADSLGTTPSITVSPTTPTEYYVTTSDACHQSRIDSIKVSISNLTSTITNIDSITCYGFTDATATVAGADGLEPYHYNWSTTGDTTATTDNLGVGTYTVTMTDAIGCTSTSSVNIVSPPQIGLILSPIDQLCLLACNGTISDSITGPYTLPVSYQWNTSPAQNTPTATNLCPGNYTLTLTYSPHNCIVTQTATVGTKPIAVALSLTPNNETCYMNCNGSISSLLTGVWDTPVTYTWSTDPYQITSTAVNLCPGDYTLTVTYSPYNCPLVQSANIATNAFIDGVMSTDPNPPTGFVPCTITFNSAGTTGAASYLWDFGDGTTSTLPNPPPHVYNTMGNFLVVLTVNSGEPNNCIDTVQRFVTVIEPSNIIIPNVFTPNDDSHNDYFTIESQGIQTIKIDIYNRWGKKVFNFSGIDFSVVDEKKDIWDGNSTSEGKCASGTYFYVIDAVGYDKKEYNLQGTLTLMR